MLFIVTFTAITTAAAVIPKAYVEKFEDQAQCERVAKDAMAELVAKPHILWVTASCAAAPAIQPEAFVDAPAAAPTRPKNPRDGSIT